jgi:hypothetical protein
MGRFRRRAQPSVQVCRTADDLVGLEALDLVLVPGATEPIPAGLAQAILPPSAGPAPPPAGITWRRSTFWARDEPGAYDWRPVDDVSPRDFPWRRAPRVLPRTVAELVARTKQAFGRP